MLSEFCDAHSAFYPTPPQLGHQNRDVSSRQGSQKSGYRLIHKLSWLFEDFQALKAADPRDKIYSLLGMVNAAGHIRVNYSDHLNHLYKEVAKWCLVSNGEQGYSTLYPLYPVLVDTELVDTNGVQRVDCLPHIRQFGRGPRLAVLL